MQDTALYQYLLGLKSPWTVSRVDLNGKGQCVEVWAEHLEGAAWACPHCSRGLPVYDHAEEHRRYPALRPASGDQHEERGTQQRDAKDQEHGLRIPEPREFQDGHLLPLRRARSLPMLNPEAAITCAGHP